MCENSSSQANEFVSLDLEIFNKNNSSKINNLFDVTNAYGLQKTELIQKLNK
jgi:hypothetical protein